MNTKNKPSTRKYTMTTAARNQRKNAARKPNAVRDWRTTKISAENLAYCRINFGSVNAAINTIREIAK